MHRICSSVLLFMVLCSQSLAGESQLIGSSDPIVAVAGDDVILPCSLEPPINAENLPVEWTRPDLEPDLVHFYRDGRNEHDGKNPFYKHRTMLFEDELVRGNVSLKLFRVNLKDEGNYTCLVKDGQVKETVIQLSVVVISEPEVSIVVHSGTGRVLQCVSGGWYPEPELEWSDSEGRLLHDAVTHRHTSTHKLYTVTSRVTVQKTGWFTCRVQLQGLNQTKETKIHVSGSCLITLVSDQAPSSAGVFFCGVLVGVLAGVAGTVLWVFWKHKESRPSDPEADSHVDSSQPNKETSPSRSSSSPGVCTLTVCAETALSPLLPAKDPQPPSI